MSISTANAGNRHLVAMPYPGRGNINPMVNLCRLISSQSPNLLITIVVTEEWGGILTGPSEPPLPPNLRLGVIPQVIPSELCRNKDFPSFLDATLTKLEAPFERLLDRLQPSPTSIVYEFYMLWVVGVANRRNLPVAALSTTSASMFTILSHFDLLVANGHFPLNVDSGREVVDYIPGLPPIAISDFPKFFQDDGGKVIRRVLESIRVVPKADFLLLASLPEFEGAAIDALKTKFSPSTTVLPIGFMIPYFNLLPTTPSDSNSDYPEWLDSQPVGSVLYISMGSFVSMTALMDEIIVGIIDSGVRCLWVTRDEDDPRLKAAAMDVEKRRLVRWCDQLRVLSHPAVGGFWSHCGWNSTLEAAFAGVPVLTYPIFWDQFLNGKMLVEEWKIGRRVSTSPLITREEIAGTVRDFMDATGEGRRKMMEAAGRVSDAFRRAVAPGGSAATNLDAFVRRIS